MASPGGSGPIGPYPTGNRTFSIGEVVDSRFLEDEDTPVLRMEDTRMSYGG